MSEQLDDLISRHGDKVREVTNYLVESPYFYKMDNEYLFFFLRRHQKAFSRFFKTFFGWTLYIDGKCARVFKDRWYNEAIWPSQRELFNFTRRDDCIGFMILLEFFEHQIDIQGVTIDDKDNLRFRYGDLLEYEHVRFQELFDDPAKKELYNEEYVRSRVLTNIIPKLEKYRFIKKVPPPKNEDISLQDTLYEALPALYHYNANRLSRGIFEEYEDPVAAAEMKAVLGEQAESDAEEGPLANELADENSQDLETESASNEEEK